jgi:hypothetical protein
MVEKKVLDIVRFFEERLKDGGLSVARLIVFGSQATGKANKESDIDIAIISDDFEGKDIFERARMTREAEVLTIRTCRVPLDIITLSTTEYAKGGSPVVELIKQGTVVSR